MKMEHIPVLLNEIIENLEINSVGVYVDATLGGAGHSYHILKKLKNAGHLYGFDQCISIYTENEWIKLQEKLLTLNTNSTDARKHIRMLAGSASECSADSQGRVIVPPNLIERADINKEVILVGNLDHIEIWSKEVWERYAKDASEKFDEIAEKL